VLKNALVGPLPDIEWLTSTRVLQPIDVILDFLDNVSRD
jgi:hypothetical protein